MKKKIMLWLLSALFILSAVGIVACGSKESNGGSEAEGGNTPPPATTEYTVTFETNGGSAVAEFKTSSIDKEPITVKEGFTFKGWYENEQFTGLRVMFPYQPQKDITLYAKWEDDFRIPSADDLMNDPFYEVNYGSGSGIHVPSAQEYQQLLEANKPLAENASYTEDFSKDFFNTRLRPYYRLYDSPDETPGAVFEMVEHGAGKAVLVTANGSVGGAYDYIQFRGMRFVDKANYEIEVQYETVTEGRAFTIAFGDMQLGVLSPVKTGEIGAMKANFTVTGYSNNSNKELRVMADSGEEPSQIKIVSITLKRTVNRPIAENLQIKGKVQVGEKLTISYDYINSFAEQNTEIRWFTTTGKNYENCTVLSELNNQKMITVTEAMKGYYIGAMVTPKSSFTEDPKLAVGDTYRVISQNSVGKLISYSAVSLKNVGDKFVENFENIEKSGNLMFEDWLSFGYITDEADKALDGKSLYVYSPTGNGGAHFQGVQFAANMKYCIKVTYKVLQPFEGGIISLLLKSYSTDSFVMMDLGSASEGVQTREFYVKTGNAEDYLLMTFTNGAPTSFVLDNIELECVPANHLDRLQTPGGKVVETFDGSNEMNSVIVANGVNEIQPGIEGNSLVLKNGTEVAGMSVFFKDLQGNLVPNAKYRVTFQYKFLSDNAPVNLYPALKNDSGVGGTLNGIIYSNPMDFSGQNKDTVYTASYDFITDGEGYYFYFFSLGGDGSVLMMDNLTVEYVSPLDELKQEGKKVTETFDGTKLISNVITADGTNEIKAGIEGNSLVLKNGTEAAGMSVFFKDLKGYLTPNAKYRITFQYKFLSDNAPVNLYPALKNDSGVGGTLNGMIYSNPMDFSGQVKDTVYTASYDFVTDGEGYYFYFFSLGGDGSILVMDNLTVERKGTLNALQEIGGKVVENFDGSDLISNVITTYGTNEIKTGIEGKSLVLTNGTEAAGMSVFFKDLQGSLAPNAKYRITFQYKFLSDNAPVNLFPALKNDSGVGGTLNGMIYSNPMDFTGQVKDTVYTASYDFVTDGEGYYFYFFSLGGDGSILVMDNLTIERIA